jgi:heterotetrameric sarcosine oxidase gamma subunit
MLERRLQMLSALGTGENAPVPVPFERPDLHVAEEPFLSVFSLRISRKQSPDITTVLQPLGLGAPAAPNRCTGDSMLSCAWIEPRAWLVLGHGDSFAPLARVPEGLVLATELSHRFAAFQISGKHAPALLSAAVSVVSSADGLCAGRCARSKFAEEIDVFIQQLSDAPEYRLMVDVGWARYAADWLADAARLTVATRD